MKKNSEYLKYEKQLLRYNRKVKLIRYGGGFLPIGLAGLSYLAYYSSKLTAIKYQDAHNDYLSKTDISELNISKEKSEYLLKKYNVQYYSSYVLAGTAITAAIIYLKYHKKTINKIKKPTYTEQISYNIFFDQFNNYHFSLNYKF